jgi:hypothetical protein
MITTTMQIGRRVYELASVGGAWVVVYQCGSNNCLAWKGPNR